MSHLRSRATDERFNFPRRFFMFAPLDSEDECGQVSALIGPLDCEKLPADLCASIVRQIDDRLFAFVPTAVADASHLRELIDDIRREEN